MVISWFSGMLGMCLVSSILLVLLIGICVETTIAMLSLLSIKGV